MSIFQVLFFQIGSGTSPATVNITDADAYDLSRAGLGATGTAIYRLNSNGIAYATLTNGLLAPIAGEWLILPPWNQELSGGFNTSLFDSIPYNAEQLSAIAASFEVNASFTSGSGGTTTGTTGSWVSLANTQTWTVSATDTSVVYTMNIQIRLASTGVVQDSATITFSVDATLSPLKTEADEEILLEDGLELYIE